MAITNLTNTQIQTLVNAAYAQATGQTAVETALDLSDFCERGTAEIGADLRENSPARCLVCLPKIGIWTVHTAPSTVILSLRMRDSSVLSPR